MDLLSANDWSQINSALQDVMDTFFKLPVTYVSRSVRKLSKFHENRSADMDATNISLLALLVPENRDDTDAKAKEMSKGYHDLSEGYLYFNYQALLTNSPPLIDGNGRPTFIPNQDSIIMLGKEVTITGVNLVGPSQSVFQLVKVHYKQELQK